MAVWTQAQRVAPGIPDPWIHGAMAILDAPGDPRDPQRLHDAEAWLARAHGALRAQPEGEQVWAYDSIAATMAIIRMRQGSLLEASVWLQGGLPDSARGRICAHFQSVCALAAWSGS